MSEQGHAKNVAYFAQYITIVTGFGAVYDPSNSLAEISKLQIKLTDCQAAVADVAPKDSIENIAINERQVVFDPLAKLVTRVSAAAAVSINDPLFSNDLRTLARKLQGRRAKAKVKDDPSTPDIDESKQSISASQMSFDNRIANFSAFIELLIASGSYAPNETELKIPALEALLAEMIAKKQRRHRRLGRCQKRTHQPRSGSLQRHRRHHRPRQPDQAIHKISVRPRFAAIQAIDCVEV